MRRRVSLASLALTTIIPTHGLMRRVRRFVANIGVPPACFLTACVRLRTPVHVPLCVMSRFIVTPLVSIQPTRPTAFYSDADWTMKQLCSCTMER